MVLWSGCRGRPRMLSRLVAETVGGGQPRSANAPIGTATTSGTAADVEVGRAAADNCAAVPLSWTEPPRANTSCPPRRLTTQVTFRHKRCTGPRVRPRPSPPVRGRRLGLGAGACSGSTTRAQSSPTAGWVLLGPEESGGWCNSQRRALGSALRPKPHCKASRRGRRSARSWYGPWRWPGSRVQTTRCAARACAAVSASRSRYRSSGRIIATVHAAGSTREPSVERRDVYRVPGFASLPGRS